MPHAGSCSDCGGPTPYCTACGIAYCAWCELGGCKTTQATLAPKCRAVAPLPPSPSLGEASLGEARSGAGQYADSGSDTDDSHREDAGDSEEGEDSHATADLLMCLSGSVERMQGDVSLDDRQRAVGVLQHVVSAVPGIFGSQQAYERWASRLTLAGNDDSDMAESDDSLPALRAATESDESAHGTDECRVLPLTRLREVSRVPSMAFLVHQNNGGEELGRLVPRSPEPPSTRRLPAFLCPHAESATLHTHSGGWWERQ